MDFSPIGKAALIAREGRRLTAYRDSVGVWTIGIGCTTIDGKPVRRGMRISAAECDALFERTVAIYVAAVVRGLAGTPVPQHVFDALVSICYNIGVGTANPRPGHKPGFLGSGFLKRIRAGDMAGARLAILQWRRPAAIIGRRQAEAEQFATPYATALPRPTVSQARIRIAAPLADVLDPAQPTPVIRPIARPPVVVPAWQPDWLAALLRWIDATYGETARHPANDNRALNRRSRRAA